MEDRKVFEALKRASSFLEEHGRERKSAEMLLCHHLGVTWPQLLQKIQDPLPADLLGNFMADVRKHASGIPVQHIIGQESFYGRPFAVNPDVLIPRPETEELVAAVLQAVEKSFSKEAVCRVVDVGTGSGVIAITLALENPRLSVWATDLSLAALRTAKENAKKLGAKVAFLHGDLLMPLIGSEQKIDVVVSNPPYISEGDFQQLDPLVKDHEPRVALSDGADGLAVYRRLIAQLPEVLAPKAIVAFEVGVGQSGAVADLLERALPGKSEVFVKQDINGKDRIVLASVET